MPYENLALKYRPQVFADLVGQNAVSSTIENAIASNRVANAFLFYGPRGCGKTSSARILAKTLNCHKPLKNNPCGKCPSCEEISQSRSIDVMEIDAASHTQVQSVRDVIIDNINIATSRDKYKIYILDEVHMLSTSAFNALLKTIEEPPSHVVFIMATTEINKVPATIVSRCQTFRFRPISKDALSKRLIEICEKEKLAYDKKAVDMIAAHSSGAMRDALTILDRVISFSHGKVELEATMENLGIAPMEIIEGLSLAVLRRDPQKINSFFKKIAEEGFDALGVLREMRNYFAECFFSANKFSDSELNKEILEFNSYAFAKLSRKMSRIIEEIKFSDNSLLAAEMALYTVIETPVDLEALVKRLESMEGQVFVPQKKTESDEIAAEKHKEREDLSLNPPSPAKKNLESPEIFQELLKKTSAEDMMLSNFLKDSSIVYLSDGQWQINFALEFPMVYVKNKLSLIEKLIENICGKKINIKLSLKSELLHVEEISNPKPVLDPQPQNKSEKMIWKDLDDEESKNHFPEYSKLEKIVKGHIRKIDKIK